MKLPSNRWYAFWLALVRIYAGLFWLSHGVPKFLDSAAFMPPNGYLPQFIAHAQTHTSGWYHGFLVGVVAPNIGIFAELVRLGEVLVGCSLLFGLFTRLGGAFGVLLALNELAAKGGLTSFGVLGGMGVVALVLSAINVVLPTGRMLGIDALLGHPGVTAAARIAQPPHVDAELVEEPEPTVAGSDVSRGSGEGPVV
ncbi:MAG: TQO small subunit DoxD [Vulcanimicrobiaceae bacterium]